MILNTSTWIIVERTQIYHPYSSKLSNANRRWNRNVFTIIYDTKTAINGRVRFSFTLDINWPYELFYSISIAVVKVISLKKHTYK